MRLSSFHAPIALVLVAMLSAPWGALAETPDAALAHARDVYQQEGPAAALPLFEQALAGYREADDRHGEAITLGLVGNCHKRMGDPRRALELLHTALAMKRELGDRLEVGKTLSHLGLVYWETAEYDEAIAYFERAIALGAELSDPQLEGSAHNNLALVYDELGDYERSLAEYRRALALYRSTDFPRGESDTLGNLGGVHLLLGRYREAMPYYRSALAISERLGAKPSMSQDIGNLAICHAGLGELAEAEADFDRALALARETGLQKEAADWLKGKGALLLETGRHSEGLELFRAALVRYETSGLERERLEALRELAALHLDLGDAAAAERWLTESLALARSIGHARGILSGELALGELELRRERPAPAVVRFRETLAGALALGDRHLATVARIRLATASSELGQLASAREQAVAALDLARAEGAKLQEAEALAALGEIERRSGDAAAAFETFGAAEHLLIGAGEPDIAWRIAHGRGRSAEALGRREEALAAYRRAVERIETVRGRLREERFRSGYLEERYQAYVDLARLLVEMDLPAEAFESAERLRARSYLDLITRHRTSSLPRALARREHELRSRVRVLERALAAEHEAESGERRQAVASFSQALAAAEREYADFLTEVSATDLETAATWSLAIPSAATVRAALPEETALVEFVAGEAEVLIFALTREGLTARAAPLTRRDLEAKVALMRELLLRREELAWRGPARSLAATLIDPLEEAGALTGRHRLLLVPHGALHLLPFSALPHGGEGRLLVEDYEISTLPSAGAVVLGGRERRAAGRALALAPAASHLRHAAEEARGVVAATRGANRLLLGAEATESAFKKLASDFRVLHLATHGSWNRWNPLLSALVLEPGGGDNGRLEVHEVLGLRLGADLVALSACETALGGDLRGEVPVGDDFVGLTRAFLHAGSAAVLASLWEVEDRSTLELMRGFYSELESAGATAALAAAQRRFLADPARAHPYHWAGFVLVGDVRETRGRTADAGLSVREEQGGPPARRTGVLERRRLP